MTFCQRNKLATIRIVEEQLLPILKTDRYFNHSHKFGSDTPNENLLTQFVEDVCKNADPTSSNQFAGWIVESYLDRCIDSTADFGRVYSSLDNFVKSVEAKIKEAIEKGTPLAPSDSDTEPGLPFNKKYLNIHNYCGLTGKPPILDYELEEIKRIRQRPFQMGLKRLKEGGFSLEQMVLTFANSIQLFTDSPYQGDIIFRGERAYVVNPKSKASAIYYGQGTTWCTANKNHNMFEYYNEQGPIYIIIDRHDNNRRYQLHDAGKEYRDKLQTENKNISLDILCDQYPDILEKIDKGYVTGYRFVFDPAITFQVAVNDYYDEATNFRLIKDYNNSIHCSNDIIKYDLKNSQQIIDSDSTNLDKTTHLTFDLLLNKQVKDLDLKGVTHLTFGYYFNQPVKDLDLKGVTHLTFGYYFNQPFKDLDLSNITHLNLDFGISFNQPFKDLDLKNVTSLTFGNNFNQPINDLDLKGVKSLTFGDYFNQPVHTIDLKRVTHLTFGDGFNQPINDLDLKWVTHLTFGYRFNQPVNNLDLKRVTHLTIGDGFNQPVEKLKLNNITHLTFGYWFNQPIEKLNLNNITHLIFSPNYQQKLPPLKNLQLIKLGKDLLYKAIDHIYKPNLTVIL